MPPPKLPKNLLALTENTVEPALPDDSLMVLASLADASPEDFQRAAGKAFRLLVIEGFRSLPAPKSWREQSLAVSLWRQAEGLDKGDKQANVAPGLVGVMRSVNRRAIVEIESGEPDDPAFE